MLTPLGTCPVRKWTSDPLSTQIVFLLWRNWGKNSPLCSYYVNWRKQERNNIQYCREWLSPSANTFFFHSALPDCTPISALAILPAAPCLPVKSIECHQPSTTSPSSMQNLSAETIKHGKDGQPLLTVNQETSFTTSETHTLVSFWCTKESSLMRRPSKLPISLMLYLVPAWPSLLLTTGQQHTFLSVQL